MKKLAKLMAVLSIALLLSCSSDDGGSSTSGEKIVGKWKPISTTTDEDWDVAVSVMEKI